MPASGRKAVFLDRDGVINRMIFSRGKPRAPYKVEDLEYFPGVRKALSQLKSAGFYLVVVTNQPDVTRGWQSLESVEAINRKVISELGIDAVRVCYHDTPDNCECRKPRPGLLLQAARELDLAVENSYMIGDRYSDIAAGRAAGCTSILVGGGASGELKKPLPDAEVLNLSEAAGWILSR